MTKEQSKERPEENPTKRIKLLLQVADDSRREIGEIWCRMNNCTFLKFYGDRFSYVRNGFAEDKRERCLQFSVIRDRIIRDSS